MSTRASVAIFSEKKIDSPKQRESKPLVPDEIFEAAQRVATNQNIELIKTRAGMYIVAYSESGPFQTPGLSKDWLPVYIARVREWDSGGISIAEMEEYHRSKE